MSYEYEQPRRRIEPLPGSVPVVQQQKQPRQKRKINIFVIVAVILVLGTIGVSAYNFYRLQGSNWECFTDRCTEYYPKEEWLNDNCVEGVCRFRYQSQDQAVLKEQLEEFPADHSIFCKSFSCDTQILRRAG